MFYELMMKKKTQTMYATIKGSLTESPEGVFSGFSNSNYLELQQAIPNLDNNSKLEIFIDCKIENYNSNNVFFGATDGDTFDIKCQIDTQKRIYGYIYNNTTSTRLITPTIWASGAVDNSRFQIKYTVSNNVLRVERSIDGGSFYGTEISLGENFTYTKGIKLCLGKILSGSIDLNNSYIKLNGTKYNLQAVVGYTIVGSPTITDGVVSGFSDSDYIKITDLSRAIPDGCVNFEINIDFNLTSVGTMQMLFSNTRTNNKVCGIWIEVGSDKKIVVRIGNGSNVQELKSNVLTNGHYKLRFVADGSNYILYLNDVVEVSGSITQVLGYTTNKDAYIGKGYGFNNVYFLDTIDMNKTWIKTYGKLVFNGQEG